MYYYNTHRKRHTSHNNEILEMVFVDGVWVWEGQMFENETKKEQKKSKWKKLHDDLIFKCEILKGRM